MRSHSLALLIVLYAGTACLAYGAKADPDCDGEPWRTIRPGRNLEARSIYGSSRFGGFWEYRKSTPADEPARIYARMTASGYSEISGNSLTCRSNYQSYTFGGSWWYDHEADEFIHEMVRDGYAEYSDDACGPAGRKYTSYPAYPMGTIINSTERGLYVSKGQLQPAGAFSPSWGPGFSPEETAVDFVLSGNPLNPDLLFDFDPVVGNSFRSWLNQLNFDSQHTGNEGAPVRGIIDGQAVEFRAMLAFPCGGDLEIEELYEVEDAEGRLSEFTRGVLVADAPLNHGGYHEYIETAPAESGKFHTLKEIRYRAVETKKGLQARMSSIDIRLNLGRLAALGGHDGLVALNYRAIPERVRRSDFKFRQTQSMTSKVQYADPLEMEIAAILTSKELLLLVELEPRNGMRLEYYPRHMVDWQLSAENQRYTVLEGAHAHEWYDFYVAEEDGTAVFWVENYRHGQIAPVSSKQYRFHADTGAWSLQSSDQLLRDFFKRTDHSADEWEIIRWKELPDGRPYDRRRWRYQRITEGEESMDVLIDYSVGQAKPNATEHWSIEEAWTWYRCADHFGDWQSVSYADGYRLEQVFAAQRTYRSVRQLQLDATAAGGYRLFRESHHFRPLHFSADGRSGLLSGEIVLMDNHVVGRRAVFHVVNPADQQPQLRSEVIERRYLTPALPDQLNWHAGSFEESSRVYHASGEWRGLLASEHLPDRVQRQYTYAWIRDFDLGVRVLQTTIMEGVETAGQIEWRNRTTHCDLPSGERVLTEVTDLPTNFVIVRERALAIDFMGRVLEREYLDGSREKFQYEGVDRFSHTDIHGETRVWRVDYDGEGLLEEESGIVHQRISAAPDADSPACSALRIQSFLRGRDDSTMEADCHYYDHQTRLIAIRRPSGEMTHFRTDYPTTGGRMDTHVYPNGETAIQSWGADRRLKFEFGPTTRACRYEYAVVKLQGDTAETHYTTRLRSYMERTATGEWTDSGEWEMEYYDMLGRMVMKEYPDHTTPGGTVVRKIAYGADHVITTDESGERRALFRDPLNRWEISGEIADAAGSVITADMDIAALHNRHLKQVLIVDDERLGPTMSTRYSTESQSTWLEYERYDQALTKGHSQLTTAAASVQRRQYTDPQADGTYWVELHHTDGRIIRQQLLGEILLKHTVSNASGEVLESMQQELDPFNRVIQSTCGRGIRTRFGYDADGRLSVIGPVQLRYSTDPQVGYSVATEWPEGGRMLRRLDAVGRVLEQSGYGVSAYRAEYDASGRIRRMSLPACDTADDWSGAHSRSWSYNCRGWLQFIHRDGYADEQFDYTLTGQRILPHAEQLKKDAAGKIIRINDSSGERHFSYIDGLLDAIQYESGPLQGWRYHVEYGDGAAVVRVSWSHPDYHGWEVFYRYHDESGIPSGRLQRVASAAGSWKYSYAADSLQSSLVDEDNPAVSVLTNHYNPHGWLERQDQGLYPFSSSIQFDYDANGRMIRRTHADATAWTMEYTANGELATARKLIDGEFPLAGYAWTYAYAGNGKRIVTTVDTFAQLYRYDSHCRLMEISGDRYYAVRGEVRTDVPVSVDLNGTELSLSGGHFLGVLTVPHDPLPSLQSPPQVLPVRVQATRVDRADNPVTTVGGIAYFPPAPERLAYDLAGNLIADGEWEYEWNSRGRLAAMQRSAAAVAAGLEPLRLEFDYDYSGLRWRKCRLQWDSVDLQWQINTCSHYLYDRGLLVMELVDGKPQWAATRGLDRSGTYNGAGGLDGILAIKTFPDSEVYYPRSDGSGNVLAYRSKRNGAEVARFEFSPFGDQIRRTGTRVERFPIAFSSQYTDHESGLVYYHHRYYHPRFGRWLSPDPLGEAGDVHLHRFVRNDPINAFDPDGLLTFWWGGNWGGPGMVNGQLGKWTERDDFPRLGHPDFVAPVDQEDWCYYYHDTCLNDVRCGQAALQTVLDTKRAERACDVNLSSCLAKVDDRVNLRAKFTAVVFRAAVGPARVGQPAKRVGPPSRNPPRPAKFHYDKPCECKE